MADNQNNERLCIKMKNIYTFFVNNKMPLKQKDMLKDIKKIECNYIQNLCDDFINSYSILNFKMNANNFYLKYYQNKYYQNEEILEKIQILGCSNVDIICTNLINTYNHLNYDNFITKNKVLNYIQIFKCNIDTTCINLLNDYSNLKLNNAISKESELLLNFIKIFKCNTDIVCENLIDNYVNLKFSDNSKDALLKKIIALGCNTTEECINLKAAYDILELNNAEFTKNFISDQINELSCNQISVEMHEYNNHNAYNYSEIKEYIFITLNKFSISMVPDDFISNNIISEDGEICLVKKPFFSYIYENKLRNELSCNQISVEKHEYNNHNAYNYSELIECMLIISNQFATSIISDAFASNNIISEDGEICLVEKSFFSYIYEEGPVCMTYNEA